MRAAKALFFASACCLVAPGCGDETGGGSSSTSGGGAETSTSASTNPSVSASTGATTSSGAPATCGWDPVEERYTCEGSGEDPAQGFPRECSGEGAGNCPGPQATCCGPDGQPRQCACPDCEGCQCSWQVVDCSG